MHRSVQAPRASTARYSHGVAAASSTKAGGGVGRLDEVSIFTGVTNGVLGLLWLNRSAHSAGQTGGVTFSKLPAGQTPE